MSQPVGPGDQANADEENLTPMQKKQLEQERRRREAEQKKQEEKERKLREAQEKKEREQQEKERKQREAQEKKERERQEKEKKRLEQEAAKEAKKNKNKPQEEKPPVQEEIKEPEIEPLPLPQPEIPVQQHNYEQQDQLQDYNHQEQGYEPHVPPFQYDPYYDQYPDEEDVELDSHYQPAPSKRPPPQQQKYNNQQQQPAAPRRNNQTQKAPLANRNYQNRSVDFDNFSWPTPPVSQSKKPAPRKPVSQPASSNYRDYHSADEGHYYSQYRKQMVPVAPPKPPPRKPKPKKNTVKPTPVFELTPRMDLIAPNVKKHNQSSFAANPSNSYKEQYYATVTQGTVSTKPINPYDGSHMDKPAPPRTKPRNDMKGMNPYTRFPPLAMSMDGMANPALMAAYHPAYMAPGYEYDRLLNPYNLMYMDPYRNGMIPNQNVRMMSQPQSYEPYTIKDYKNLKSNMQEKKSIGHENFNPKVKQEKFDKMNKRKEAGDIFMKSNSMGRRSPDTTTTSSSRDKDHSQRTSTISDRTSYSDVLGGGNDFIYSNALDNYNYHRPLDLTSTNYGLGTNYNSLDYLNLNTSRYNNYGDNLMNDLPSNRLVSDVNSRYNFNPPPMVNTRQYGLNTRYDRNDSYEDYQPPMPSKNTNQTRKPGNNNINMPQNSRTRVY